MRDFRDFSQEGSDGGGKLWRQEGRGVRRERGVMDTGQVAVHAHLYMLNVHETVHKYHQY